MSAGTAFRERFAANRGALRDVGVAVGVVAVLVWLGLLGWRTGDRHAERARELQAVLDATSGWLARLAPAAPAESAAWAASSERVAELSTGGGGRLALLESVAQRAVAVGIRGARVTFAADPGGASGRDTEGWSVQTADYGLSVNFEADYWSAVALVGALPPVVEVHSLVLLRSERGAAVDLLLAVREATEEREWPGSARDFSAADWRGFAPYLRPVQPPTRVAGTQAAPPGATRDPFSRPAPVRGPAVARAPERAAPSWTVSMIMITDRRRIAVIDQRVVAQGDTLAGGAQVAAIHADHVVVREQDGRTRQLRCLSCPSPRGAVPDER